MIPHFTSDFEMVSEGVLSALGIETATSIGKTNFSRMPDSSSRDLFIDKAIHKTFISVNEKGTQAGAVTAESFLNSGGGERVVLDRPFVYIYWITLVTLSCL